MSVATATHAAWFDGKPLGLQAAARHHLATALNEPRNSPPGELLRRWFNSEEFRQWSVEFRNDFRDEHGQDRIDELRALADEFDSLSKGSEDSNDSTPTVVAAEPRESESSPIVTNARWLLAYGRIPDSERIVLAALLIEEENSQEQFTTSQIRGVLNSAGVELKNPTSLIQSLAQKDQPDIIIEGKSGKRQELLMSLSKTTGDQLRAELSKTRSMT